MVCQDRGSARMETKAICSDVIDRCTYIARITVLGSAGKLGPRNFSLCESHHRLSPPRRQAHVCLSSVWSIDCVFGTTCPCLIPLLIPLGMILSQPKNFRCTMAQTPQNRFG